MSAPFSFSSSLFLLFLLFLLFITPSSSSEGDRSPLFQQRARDCYDPCESSPSQQPKSLSSFETLLGWDCLSDCKYQVMRAITQERILQSQPVLQYYGKWPFLRIWGLQEPASVLFSLANLITHALCLLRFLRQTSPSYRYRKLWVTYSLVAVNTWVWSTVYHARDLLWTERVDYLCATFSVFNSLFAALVVTLSLPLQKATWLAAAFLILFLAHEAYLNLVDFDYGLNILVTAAVGILSHATWVIWQLRTRRSHGWQVIAIIFYFLAASSLELFDFPPIWDLLDAHAIWHALTVPWAWMWCSFLIQEANYHTLWMGKVNKIA